MAYIIPAPLVVDGSSLLQSAAGVVSLGTVQTANLAAGILSADVAGRAKMASGFFDAATHLDKVAASAVAKSRVAVAGTWANAELANLPALGVAPSPARPTAIAASEVADAPQAKPLSGSATASATGATDYHHPLGANAGAGTASELLHEWIVPRAGTLKNLNAYNLTQPASGKTPALTVRVNEVDTAITVSWSNADAATTLKQDLVHTVAVAAGDRVSIKTVQTAASSVSLAWELEFVPS